jgi:xyloglucan-specific endo-beta-1,4-glucanase
MQLTPQLTVPRLACIGSVYPIGSRITTVNLAGVDWDLFSGPNGAMRVFSFIPAGGSWKFSFTADIKLFFHYLADSQEYPITQQNLIGKWSQLLKYTFVSIN